MKIKSPIGFLALWSAFLAVGTWMLPLGALAIGGTSSAQAAPSPDAEAESYLTAQAAAFGAMVDAGELDPDPYSISSVDLDSDGFVDPILVVPSRVDGGGGRLIAVRGGDARILIDLTQSNGEIGFGLQIGVVDGAELGGVKTVLVPSFEWSPSIEGSHVLIVRAISGITGQLIAVARHSIQSSGLASLDLDRVGRDFKLAGDLDATGEIEMADVLSVVESVHAEATEIAADLDCDGIVTMADVGEALLRTGADGGAQASVLARLAATEEGQRFVAAISSQGSGATREAQPHHWSSWKCWSVAALIALEVAGLLLQIAACGVIGAAPSPATILCLLSILCTFISILSQIVNHQLHCNVWVNGDGGGIQQVDDLLDTVSLLSAICAALTGGIAGIRHLLEQGGGIRSILERLLRGYGLH